MLVNDAPMATVSLIDHRKRIRERERELLCFSSLAPNVGPHESNGRGRRSERDVAAVFNDSAIRYVVIKVFTTPVCLFRQQD